MKHHCPRCNGPIIRNYDVLECLWCSYEVEAPVDELKEFTLRVYRKETARVERLAATR